MEKYNLTKAERETIITFDEESPEATVYTCNKALIRKLNSYCSKNDSYTFDSGDEYSATYKVPKKYVTIRFPKAITVEERVAMAIKARERFGKNDMRGE